MSECSSKLLFFCLFLSSTEPNPKLDYLWYFLPLYRYLIKSGQAHVVVDSKKHKVATLGPGQWFGEEVFKQAVQIERRRSTMVSSELNRRLQVCGQWLRVTGCFFAWIQVWSQLKANFCRVLTIEIISDCACSLPWQTMNLAAALAASGNEEAANAIKSSYGANQSRWVSISSSQSCRVAYSQTCKMIFKTVIVICLGDLPSTIIV